MIRFLKYLKGYVRIKVWGFSPERFMNLCGNRNLLLWDIEKEGETYYMCVSLDGFYQLRPIVRKTGTKAVILKRCGLPFLIPKLFARKVFLLGLVLCVAFWIGSAFFVWEISVDGNYQITEDVFLTFLEKNDVTVGSRKAGLDLENLEKLIRREFPEITWTSAKLNGTKLEIAVKENDAPVLPQETETRPGGMDLTAQYAGTVVSMIVRSGVPKVAVGDTVEPGTVLVEGKVPVLNEDATVREYQYVVPDADIYLEHWLTYEDTLPFDTLRRVYTGRTKTRYFLRLGGYELKMPQWKLFLVYDCVIRENKPALFEKLRIPVFWGSNTYREYQNVESVYRLEQAKDILGGRLADFLSRLEEKGVQIIEKNVKMDTADGMWRVTAQLNVREPAVLEEGTP